MSASEPEILLGKLTRREFRERMASGELAGCLIPVAAIEQHLEHMAQFLLSRHEAPTAP